MWRLEGKDEKAIGHLEEAIEGKEKKKEDRKKEEEEKNKAFPPQAKTKQRITKCGHKNIEKRGT